MKRNGGLRRSQQRRRVLQLVLASSLLSLVLGCRATVEIAPLPGSSMQPSRQRLEILDNAQLLLDWRVMQSVMDEQPVYLTPPLK